MEEGGERKWRWRHPAPRWIPPQLQAEKLRSVLFRWLPPLQTWLINIGLPSVSHLLESRWHFHTKAAPFLSMKMLCAGASSPSETIYTYRAETEVSTWSGHGYLLEDALTPPCSPPAGSSLL